MRIPTLLLALGLAAGALPLAAAVEGPLSVRIVEVSAQRSGASVLVFVDLAGSAPGLLTLVGMPVSGEVAVTSPTPCWPDARACADVVTTKSEPFVALAGPLGVWQARVGPFEYPTAPAGFACETLVVVAEVETSGAVASDRDSPRVCA